MSNPEAVGGRRREQRSDSDSTVAPKSMSMLVMVLLASFAALGPLSLDIYLPAVSEMAKDLKATASQGTLSLSVFFVGMALGQLFVGPWSDRVGRRVPVIIGLALACVGTITAALAANIYILLVGRSLQALGGSAVLVTGRAATRDHLDERGAASFFSLTSMVNSLMPTIAPSFGAVILLFSGWRGIFGLVAGVAGVMLLVALGAFPESHRPQTAAQQMLRSNLAQTYLDLLKQRQFLGYLLAVTANGASYFTYLSLSPLVLMQVYHLSPSKYGLVLAINGAGLFIMTHINRRLLRVHYPTLIMRVCSVMSFLLVIPLLVWSVIPVGGLAVMIALVFLVISSSSFVQSNAMAAGLSLAPGRTGAAAALFGAALFGSGTLASLIGGITFDGTPRSMILIIAAAVLCMATALHCLALRDSKR